MVTLAAALLVLYLLLCTPLGELLWGLVQVVGMFAVVLAIPVGTVAFAVWLISTLR